MAEWSRHDLSRTTSSEVACAPERWKVLLDNDLVEIDPFLEVDSEKMSERPTAVTSAVTTNEDLGIRHDRCRGCNPLCDRKKRPYDALMIGKRSANPMIVTTREPARSQRIG